MIAYYPGPSENGEDEVVRLSEDEAIRRSKAWAVHKGFTYPNDHEALIDFMVIHWAWKEQSE
jgi:hypothetical protein